MDVVILAGGRCEPELAEFTGVTYRAEVPYEGKTMLDIVRGATSSLGEPIIVGGPAGASTRRVEAGPSFVESLRNGLSVVTSDNFLLTTVDLPCLTEIAVVDFISRCDFESGVNYPVIEASACEAKFPGMRRTTLRLKDGEFTGGNIGLVNTEAMRKLIPLLEKAYLYRKSPAKLAGLIGYGLLGRVVLSKMFPGTLSLKQLEAKVSDSVGVCMRVVLTPFPEIGADIDNLSQYKSLINL